MRHGDNGISAAVPAQVTMAGTAMLPLPRITLASELKIQTRIAPEKKNLGKCSAPLREGTPKNNVGVGQCRTERRSAAAHHHVEPRTAAEHSECKDKAKHHRDGQRMQRQRVGILPASGAERPCD